MAFCSNTCGFSRKSAMSVVHKGKGHVLTFFCARKERPPCDLSLIKLLPAKAPCKQALQKL